MDNLTKVKFIKCWIALVEAFWSIVKLERRTRSTLDLTSIPISRIEEVEKEKINLEEMNTSEGDVLQEENQEVENPVINQNDQMGPVMAMLNQLQQQLVNAQAEITALKNKEAVDYLQKLYLS